MASNGHPKRTSIVSWSRQPLSKSASSRPSSVESLSRSQLSWALGEDVDIDENEIDDNVKSLRKFAKSFRDLSRGASLRQTFDGSMSTSEIMNKLGRGGTSRMFARGKNLLDELSSVGRFFSKGSILERATAFTKTATAYDRNRRSTRVGLKSASAEHPVQEMVFYNIGGAKVFYYYGLDVVRSPDHVTAAGPHVRDTAVGVLMLDQYKIHERPGDPSNPLTFWPYQTFFAIPQGITFQKCKTVGSSGSNALRDYPLETSAICQALLAMAEVASKRGYRRLMIVGDCGYYALSAEAFAKNLSCWGNQSWEPHPDGPFASFRVPHFRSPALDLDIILSLGTTQLISSSEPDTNLSTQLGDDTSVVYLTADTCGWYGGEALEKVELEYTPFLCRPWVSESWHFNLDDEISMLDIVARVNASLLHGVVIEHDNEVLFEVIESLIEVNAGSTAYICGLFIGHTASQVEKFGRTPEERAWVGAAQLTQLVEEMIQVDGTPHPEDIIVEKVSPVFDFLQPILKKILGRVTGCEQEKLTVKEEFQILAALIGNPLLKGSPPPETYEEFKLAVALRIQDTFLSLLSVSERTDDVEGLLVGKSYVEFFARFNAKVNNQVLSKVKTSHAIDGSKFPLFDCRYVPGFGFNVKKGLTVWAMAQNYFWLSTILLRFSEIMQEEGWMGSATFHLECTELFSFTPFFQEMGLPVVDGVNSILIASRSTDAPMRFVNFKQQNNIPPTPSALVADVEVDSVFGSAYYRDDTLPLRTPTKDGEFYQRGMSVCGALMEEDRARWRRIRLAQPLFEEFNLKWGAEDYELSRPSESIYPASSALDILRYVKQGEFVHTPEIPEENCVQYAPAGGSVKDDENFHSFFGGDVFRDKKRGRKSIGVLQKECAQFNEAWSSMEEFSFE